MFRIRDFRASDSSDIIDIDREAFNSLNPSYDLFVYLAYGSDIIVAEKNGRVIGYVVLMDLGEVAKIMSIAVKTSHRGKGVGKALLEEAIRRCRKRRKKKITLEVRISNVKAQELYKKYGFEIVGKLEKYYSDGEDAYLMQLKL